VKHDIPENHQPKDSQAPLISFSEIGLFLSYLLVIWLIPLRWLDSAIGAMAFAVAGKVNPYLSTYSIAFAESPAYFVHCQLLATLFFIPWGFVLIVKRNGGIDKWQKILIDHIGERSSLFFYWLKLSAFLVPMIYGMLWLVSYPFGSAAYAMWVSKIGIPISSFLLTYLISLYLGMSYTVGRLLLIHFYRGN